MSELNPTAVVLGGTYPHIRLLQHLNARGFRTVLIDYHDNPCAKPFADIHYPSSTLDLSRVIDIARCENAALVMSSCVDQANLIACSVAEELGLPHPYSAAQAKIVTNKPLMKQFMRDHGIPTSAFIVADKQHRLTKLNLNLPVIVKPADSNSSKGIVRIDALDRLDAAVEDAIAISRSGEVIVEEYLEGREVGIDCYIFDGEPYLLMTKTRRKIPPEASGAQQIYGCFWPADLTPDETDSALNIARRIARALGLKNSPLMIQAIVSERGIQVIEAAARFGGGESFKIIELATGIDIIDLSIRSFLNEPVSLSIGHSRKMYAETFIYSNACVFDRIETHDPNIDYLHHYKTPGMVVGAALTSNNRIGCFIVSGDGISELRRKIGGVVKDLRVIGKNGKNFFLSSLYKCECEA
jgi:biotin carboxylase